MTEEINVIEEFGNKFDLEEQILASPLLISNSDHRPLALWHRKPFINGIESRSLVFVDSWGLPVFVEVNLWKNSKSISAVIGHILDCASFFSAMAQQDFSKLHDSNLDNLVKSIFDNLINYDRQGAQINRVTIFRLKESLTNGNVRLVLAFDKLPDDDTDPELKVKKENLIRIIQLFNSKSENKIELIEIEKMSSNNNNEIEDYRKTIKLVLNEREDA
ncbi:hypothetical protein KAH27_10520 [bacterium]|nr:hypothetical protein [bacterium]